MSGLPSILVVTGGAQLEPLIASALGERFEAVAREDLDDAVASAGEMAAVAAIVHGAALGDDPLESVERLRAAHANLPVVVVVDTGEAPAELTALVTKRSIYAVSCAPHDRLGETALYAAELGAVSAHIEQLQESADDRLNRFASLARIVLATHDLSSYDDVACVIARDLHNVMDVDLVAALLVMDDAAPVLHLHCSRPCDDTFLRAIRDRCLETFRSTSAGSLDEDQLTINFTGEPLSTSGAARWPEATAHASIRIAGANVGLVLASSTDSTFDEEDGRLLEYLADGAAESVSRLSARIYDDRRRLSMMIESMADGLIMTDLHSDDLLINPAARRMLNIDSSQAVTQQYLKERLGFYPFDLVSTSSESGGPLREELTFQDKVLHSMVSPVRDASGRVVGVVVVLRDFTEAKELERRQHEFVSVVSHELRTPLTSITGALDIALSEYAGRLSDKQRRYLTMARDSCTKLNSIVDDLLDVARSEQGKMPIHLIGLDLDALALEVSERYRPAAQSKGVVMRIENDEREPIRIAGDPDRLTQVLNNLLSNALKFTPTGGEVVVSIFGPSVSKSHVGVSVFNNGEPIPVDARERVFEKFEQVGDSATRKVGGTGLGLAISRGIVEAHGGRIWVESEAAGTRFVFTLPAAAHAEPDVIDTDVDLAGHAANTQAGMVLLVDADVKTTYILKGILMAAGHAVEVTANPTEALSIARSSKPSLVILSTELGVHEAVATAEILRHDPETRKAAILIVGEASPKIRSGLAEFLPKPLDPALFRDTCARLIAEAGRAVARNVLVVDDDPSIRAICRAVLEGAGYTVREAQSGTEAIQLARRSSPDLALLDIMMPDLDGFQTAEQLRANPADAQFPVIFLSARGETADKVNAFRIGAEDYIVKPFVAAEMVARVGKALERRDRELGASPTTQLPGSAAIEAEIERRLGDPAAVFCYLDLDNLKAFNDHYGYAKADGVIRQTGDIIRDVVGRLGSTTDFIGHIAGDDFVFITSADVADSVCRTLCDTFDRLIPLYYNRADRERGFIETKDRYGEMRRFPIMSVSVAAVTAAKSGIESYSDLASAAARGKKLAKKTPGSSYVRDELVVLSGPQQEPAPGERAADRA